MAFMTVSSGHAEPADHDRADAQALDLAKRAIALRSVRGPDNQVPQVAALFKSKPPSRGADDPQRSRWRLTRVRFLEGATAMRIAVDLYAGPQEP
jgi:hypothetical protein